MYTETDRQDYAQFLRGQLRDQRKQQKTIAREFNINNLNEDLKDLEKNE